MFDNNQYMVDTIIPLKHKNSILQFLCLYESNQTEAELIGNCSVTKKHSIKCLAEISSDTSTIIWQLCMTIDKFPDFFLKLRAETITIWAPKAALAV